MVDLVSTIIRVLEAPRACKGEGAYGLLGFFNCFIFLWFSMVRPRSNDLVRVMKKIKE